MHALKPVTEGLSGVPATFNVSDYVKSNSLFYIGISVGRDNHPAGLHAQREGF